jgi:diguanylate cyclase (GGDEF)-like protein
MVLSFSLVEAMKDCKGPNFDYRTYWRRSLTTAVAARLLAEHSPTNDTEEAFVAGLLCDIGALAAAYCAPDDYAAVLQEYNDQKGALHELERMHFGVTHEGIAAKLLEDWGLPEKITISIADHHKPIADPVESETAGAAELARVIRAATHVGELFCQDTAASELESIQEIIREGLGFSAEKVQSVFEEVDGHVRETASLFSIDVGQTQSYKDIQAAAVVQLAQMTMATEIERAQLEQSEQKARAMATRLADENEELSQKARTDPLTGVPNRAALEQHFEALIRDATVDNKAVGVLLLDVDRFKKLNDTFGHQVGDEALRRLGKFLAKLSDKRIFAARYGGEEFIMVVDSPTEHQVQSLAETLRLGVTRIRVPAGQREISLTISVGAVFATPECPNFTPEVLIQQADQCMYQAKNTGRNRVVAINASRTGKRSQAAGASMTSAAL